MQLRDGSVVSLDENTKANILRALHEMTTSALRCLGFAYKDELLEFETYDGNEDHPAHSLLLEPSKYPSIESDLTFVGLVGLRVSFYLDSCPAAFPCSTCHRSETDCSDVPGPPSRRSFPIH